MVPYLFSKEFLDSPSHSHFQYRDDSDCAATVERVNVVPHTVSRARRRRREDHDGDLSL